MSSRAADWWIPVVTDFLLSLDNAVTGARSGVIVIGATNNIQGVDAAIMRPGRLERAIEVLRPGHAGILNVLRYHVGTSLPGVDLTEIGHLLGGSTPADIMMAVRAARRLARTAGRDLLVDDLRHAIAPTEDLPPDTLWRAAIHEAGHAIGSLAVPSGTLKRCIISGAQKGSAGQTVIAWETDDMTTRDTMERRAVTFLCARAAEALLIGNICVGSGGDDDSDLALVTRMVATLHASSGLGETLIYLAADNQALEAVRKDGKLRHRVERHMQKLQTRADQIISRNRDAVVAVAEALQTQRHLTGDQIRRIFAETASDLTVRICH